MLVVQIKIVLLFFPLKRNSTSLQILYVNVSLECVKWFYFSVKSHMCPQAIYQEKKNVTLPDEMKTREGEEPTEKRGHAVRVFRCSRKVNR